MNKVKDFIAILRDGLLLCMFLLLLFFPVVFNGILERAGFSEGTLMGFTWKKKALESQKVADTSQQLALKATNKMEEMQANLNNISKKLDSLPATGAITEIKTISASIDSSKTRLINYNVELKEKVQMQRTKLDNIFENTNVLRKEK